jgi:acyl-CoA thioester hydrolase
VPRIYSKSFLVPPDAIDVYRHVNNLAYLRWMQDVATEHSAARGWPAERYLRDRAGWVVRSHFIEYLRQAFEGDAISAHTWVADLTGRSSRRKYLFSRDHDGKHLARAETLWVYVDFVTGRARAIPDELVTGFVIFPDDDEVLRELALEERARGTDGPNPAPRSG